MIDKKQATQALFAGFEERSRDGALNPESEDCFFGSYDRWRTAIAALGHAPAGGNILDIEAWDGSRKK